MPAGNKAPDPMFLAPLAVSKKFGITRSTIYTLLARGDLRARKCGRLLLIDAAHAAAYFDALPLAQVKPQPHPAPSVRRAQAAKQARGAA